jgi:hypothetical protein
LFVQTRPVDKAFYVEIMTKLFAGVCGKRPEFFPNNMFVHHDVPVHKTPLSKHFTTKATTDKTERPLLFT